MRRASIHPSIFYFGARRGIEMTDWIYPDAAPLDVQQRCHRSQGNPTILVCGGDTREEPLG